MNLSFIAFVGPLLGRVCGGQVVRHGPAPDPVRRAAPAVSDVTDTYCFGDGLGVNCLLELKKDGTFTFSWDGCLGEFDKNGGPFVREGDLVVLRPARPNRRDGFRGTGTRLCPVKWADRLYLIAEEQMLGFCGRFQQGWRGKELLARSGFYYLRQRIDKIGQSEPDKLNGAPQVPPAYRHYLKDPFNGIVSKVADPKAVPVNKGSADGVVVGTKLSAQDGTRLSVKAVLDHECECEVRMKGDKAPRVGARVDAVAV